MLACYHTHTVRCHHAFGEDEEYVKSAIAEGVKILGFSDHAPMRYPEGYVSYYKMHPDELAEYCESVRSLREKYRDKIEIHLGLEVEYYPLLWEDSLKLWRDAGIEYLLLGQHFITEEYVEDKRSSFKLTANPEHLVRYADIVVGAIQSGKITYVAHPDVFNYDLESGDVELYKHEMGRIIAAARDAGMPLELNLLGVAEQRHYPNPAFWEEVGKLGASAILGCDAHVPTRVAKSDEILAAKEFLGRYGVPLVETVDLKRF